MIPGPLLGFALDVAASLRADRGLTFHPLRLDPALTEKGAPASEGAHHQSFERDHRAAPVSPDDVARSLLRDIETGQPVTGPIEMWRLPAGQHGHEVAVHDDGMYLRFVPRYRHEEGRLYWCVDYCFRAVPT